MASLYESTQSMRKIAVFVLIGLVILLILQTFAGLRKSEIITPEGGVRVYMATNRVFGELEPILIPGLAYNTNAIFIREGFHTSYPDASYVYAIEKPRQKLSTFDTAKNIVDVLGFDKETFLERDEEDEKTYTWTLDRSTKVITLKANSQQWNMTTDYYNNINALAQKKLSSDITTYASQMKRLLSQLWSGSSGLLDGIVDVRYAKLGLDGVFFEETNIDEAGYVFLNVYRELPLADPKARELLPKEYWEQIPLPVTGKVYKTDPRQGQMSLIVSNQLRDYAKDIFKIEFTDYTYTESGAYLLVTPDEALTEVQRGKGSLVLLQPQGSDYFAPFPTDITVTEFRIDATLTELAFWEPEEWTGFAHPIFIFRGIARLSDGRLANFVFYIDAIKRV